MISIHAPTRGATRRTHLQACNGANFNPRPHEGCDVTDYSKAVANSGFQSTHPRGVRQFTARPRNAALNISIHAPTRGATRPSQRIDGNVKFQSTHPRGVRPCPCFSAWHPSLFQSTHPRGVRPQRTWAFTWVAVISIHAPTRGATNASSRVKSTASTNFNPRTHEGCDRM